MYMYIKIYIQKAIVNVYCADTPLIDMDIIIIIKTQQNLVLIFTK